MKLLAIRFARSSGYCSIRTFHHPDNANAIGMNRRLGFVDDDAQTNGTVDRRQFSFLAGWATLLHKFAEGDVR